MLVNRTKIFEEIRKKATEKGPVEGQGRKWPHPACFSADRRSSPKFPELCEVLPTVGRGGATGGGGGRSAREGGGGV